VKITYLNKTKKKGKMTSRDDFVSKIDPKTSLEGGQRRRHWSPRFPFKSIITPLS